MHKLTMIAAGLGMVLALAAARAWADRGRTGRRHFPGRVFAGGAGSEMNAVLRTN